MSVIGIDIGSSHCVMATVARGSVQIIRNELSERQTPSLVTYTEDRRLIGDLAQSQLLSNFKNTCRGIKNLLGMIYDPSYIQDAQTYSFCPLAEAENGLVGYQVNFQGTEQVVSVTRVLAALLFHLVKIATKYLGKKPAEVVIACPGWYTDINRSAMLAAAEIAGIQCLRVFSEHTATALDYGIYRMAHFTDSQPTRVVFVAMGHSSTSVSVVEFTKEKLKILSEGNDKSLGGRDMDSLIVNFISSKFYSKTGLQCLKSIKHKIKLEEQAAKIKKVLSANTEAFCNLECFMEDNDINETITRKDFIDMCKEALIPKLKALLDSVMKSCGLSFEEINSIELVGGCTRIPWVINQVQDFFQKEPSRTLSSDECVARGCALQAAMVSVHYKVTDYGCHEFLNHAISLSWSTIPSIPPQYQNCPEYAFPFDSFKSAKLVPQGAITNTKYKFHMQCEGPIYAFIHYSNPDNLPAGTPIGLDHCLIMPPKGTSEVYLDVGINFHGQYKFLSAYTMKKVKSNSQLQPETSANAVENPQSDEGQNQNAESTNANQNNVPPSPTKSTPKYIRGELFMKSIPFKGKYTSDQISDYRNIEVNLNTQDSLSERRLSKMNELETSILSSRNRMTEDLNEFFSSSEKDSVSSALNNLEDWLYNNFQADMATIEAKIEELTELMSPILERFKKFSEINNAISVLATKSSMCNSYVSDEQGSFPSLPIELKQSLEQMTSQINNFITNMPRVNPLTPDEAFLNQIKSYLSSISDLEKQVSESLKAQQMETKEQNESMDTANVQEMEVDTQSEKDQTESN